MFKFLISGKSTFVKNLLLYRNEVFDQPFSRVIFCCPAEMRLNSSYFDELKSIYPTIEFLHGLPNVDALQLRTDKTHKLIIVDDQFEKSINSIEIHDIFKFHSHHDNISIILIGHNLFARSKFGSTLSRNATAKIVFYDKADQLFLSTLSRRIFPHNPNILTDGFDFLIENYPENFSKYIVIDTRPISYLPKKLMVRSNIFPEKDGVIRPVFFIPNID